LKLNLMQKKQQQQPLGKFRTVINIDFENEAVHLCNMTMGEPNSYRHETAPLKSKSFDDEFFKNLSTALSNYSKKYPVEQNASATVVVSDNFVSTNILNIPTMGKKTMDSLNVLISEFYKNREQLKINQTLISQNKQYSTFALSIMNQELLSKIYGVCAENRMTPHNITFNSNAIINGVINLNNSMSNKTYAFLDIKPEKSVVILVNKGRTAGFIDLPFGSSILHKNRLAYENMLFDNPEADLLVLNAMEKARLKQLTMMENESAAQTAQALNEQLNENTPDSSYESELEKVNPVSATQKVLPKKTPLKLPKFMTRPLPNSENEYVYENFRIFIKWALNAVTNNKGNFTEKVDRIYVNMPGEFDFLYDMTNAEKGENKFEFLKFNPRNAGDFLSSLELYGGFFDESPNTTNNF